ncbi:hypothetical protein AVEN_110014-1 [Araneus ventricosus]|uniref:Uncharacterized protein n=1 Tax=Araneus ventricosus TaxID=182803 RepID=A0A4Y2JB22_ARAVE|nr:hypothetical protein AVEN_110014-1 [Araneus ventricosus]
MEFKRRQAGRQQIRADIMNGIVGREWRETAPDANDFYSHFSDRMWSSQTRNLSPKVRKRSRRVCLQAAKLFINSNGMPVDEDVKHNAYCLAVLSRGWRAGNVRSGLKGNKQASIMGKNIIITEIMDKNLKVKIAIVSDNFFGRSIQRERIAIVKKLELEILMNFHVFRLP